jgi:hypothetical protein
MISRCLLPAKAFAGDLAAQTFIRMSGSQSWMCTKNEAFAHENCEFGTATYTAVVCTGLVKCRDLLLPIWANVVTAIRT